MWKMVLWGATFNAVVVVGLVSLLLFSLPMAILCFIKTVKKIAVFFELTNIGLNFSNGARDDVIISSIAYCQIQLASRPCES